MTPRIVSAGDPRLAEVRAIRAALAGYNLYPPDDKDRIATGQIDVEALDAELWSLRSFVLHLDNLTGQRTIIGHRTVVRGSNYAVVPVYVEDQ